MLALPLELMELFYQAVRLGATRSILYIRMTRTTSRDGGGGRHISEARASGRERQDEMESHGTRHARQKRPGILREGSDEEDCMLKEKRGGSGEEEKEEAASRDTQRPVGIICTFCRPRRDGCSLCSCCDASIARARFAGSHTEL